jgi:hypothetical protein
MIHLPPLKLHSGLYNLSELTIHSALKLAAIPSGQYEYAASEFIRHALNNSDFDPLEMTVETRLMLVAHYLSATSDSPDFSVGRANFSDYFIGETGKTPERIEIGEVEGDNWHVTRLKGRFSEAIERTMGMSELNNRVHWIIGRMACQLVRDNDDPVGDDVDEWLLNRIKVFANMPESSFIQLYSVYESGLSQLLYLFEIENDGNGIVVMPIDKGGNKSFGAARFPASSCISGFVRTMA